MQSGLVGKKTISIIIPAYNEGSTIDFVLRAVCSWEKAKEIIVVSDGSTDNTVSKVKKFGSAIRLISLEINKGKGNAVAEGISKSSSDVIVLLDADIVGLTPIDIDELVSPVVNGTADMTVALHNFWGIGNFRPYNKISGQRCFLKKRVLPYLSLLRASGGGAEFIINKIHKNKRVVFVTQPHVKTLRKIDKWPWVFAWFSYIKQARDFGKGIYLSKKIYD